MKNERHIVTKDEFECWVDDIPNRLERFKQSMPKGIIDKLDFSLESLDIIEKRLLDNYKHYLCTRQF